MVFKFGNWENEDAFILIDTRFNEISSIYTLRDIYHLSPGKVETEDGYSIPIENARQLKLLFKNKLIIIIEFNNGYEWELPGYRNNKHLATILPLSVKIRDYKKEDKEIRKKWKNEIVLPNLKTISFKETPYPESEDLGMCQICFDSLKSGNKSDVSVIENCGHMFHTDCVKDHVHLRGTCPICRKSVGDSFKKVSPQYIPKSTTEFGKKKNELNKVIKLIRYLSK